MEMMKSYVLDGGVTINELVERYQGSEKLRMLYGKRPKLALRPFKELIVYGEHDLSKIIDFCRDSQVNNRLVIGFFSYDLGLYLHRLRPKNKTVLPLAELYSFENWVEESSGETTIKYRDKGFLEEVESWALQSGQQGDLPPADFTPSWSLGYYKEVFDKAKEYIKSGDVYQINLSYPLNGVCTAEAKDIFIQTNKANRASMAGLFQAKDFDLISLSPETFINIEGRNIETFPIKGTRARSKDIRDEQIESSLINDSKEQAELNMISDLLRNDLSIVCKPSSVKIKSHRNTAKLSRVIHTYSHITGELNSGVSSIDAVFKLLPGGSISGCPKKRALEIIDDLEEYARGPYTGTLFTLDPADNLEASILIRTLIKRGDSLSLPVGGGIVFDSEYRAEYQETLDKAVSITKVFDSD